jgi:organic hydroperoxide reductase OsmC/OhrA
MSDRTHRYTTTCEWTGSTAGGYDAYDRSHTAIAPPAAATLRLSADPAFGGDPTLLNPEQLLVLAASSCQMLSFLAVAARARIDVRGYHDEADGVMPDDDQPVRITRVHLRPVITVRGVVDDDRLLHLCEVAHQECYIANSLQTDVTIEPVFVRQ